ncbi:43kDa postsynaptic protein [Parasponia andersonii]|uniref:RING-type E3 ubiquitin transferase n=1 Tax=Parasponia andersonii TaxID=3476 RepID=A0A2P5B2I2_PARAD|nr:43kDa postsynaptic protein [Parasponia andersonii]
MSQATNTLIANGADIENRTVAPPNDPALSELSSSPPSLDAAEPTTVAPTDLGTQILNQFRLGRVLNPNDANLFTTYNLHFGGETHTSIPIIFFTGIPMFMPPVEANDGELVRTYQRGGEERQGGVRRPSGDVGFGRYADPILASSSGSQETILQTHERLFNEESKDKGIESPIRSSGIEIKMDRESEKSENCGNIVKKEESAVAMLRSAGAEVYRSQDLLIYESEGVYLSNVSDEEDHEENEINENEEQSYEDLFVLGDEIGYVNIGLSEELINENMTRRTYQSLTQETPTPDNNHEQDQDLPICCICQEELRDGEELGGLDCNHYCHTECLRRWLMQKNSCPICQRRALNVD